MQGLDTFLVQRRALVVVFSVYAAIFLGIFFFGVFTFPVKNFLPVFRSQWTLNESVIRFMSIILTAHCTSVLLTYALSPTSGIGSDFSRSVSATLVTFLILTVVYSILIEGAAPGARRVVSSIGYRTEVNRTYFDAAKRSFEAGRFDESKRYLSYYRSVDPGNQEAADLWGTLTQRLANDLREREANQPAVTAQALDLTPAELISRAEGFLDSEDAFSAYYYANLAKESAAALGESWRSADRIAAIAASRIEKLGLSSIERAEAELFVAKQRGIEAISSRDPERNVEGYYLFAELALEFPDDVEVDRYLKEASILVESISFFLDEAEAILPLPGTRDIVFVNARPDENGALPFTEIVSIEKLVFLDIGTYAEGIEVIGLETSGGVSYRYRAPLAELIGGVLIMRGIDRADPTRYTEPDVIESNSDIDPNMLVLRPDASELMRLSIAEDQVMSSGFFSLLDIAEIAVEYGHDATEVAAAALDRLSAPFIFFSLSLITAAFGIKFNIKVGRPPIASMLLLPALPVVVYGLTEGYRYASRIITAWLATSVDFSLSLVLVLVWQLIILVAVIFVLAGAERK